MVTLNFDPILRLLPVIVTMVPPDCGPSVGDTKRSDGNCIKNDAICYDIIMM